MSRAVIVDALRTPVGRYGGALKDVRPDDLGARVLSALLERTGLDPGSVDDVILGNANGAGEENRNVARMCALLAGLPVEVPGQTVNRLCGSGLQAVASAAHAIAAGEGEVFLAGGDTDAKGSDRYQVIVHADAQTLDTDADGRCEIEGVSPIAAETARRMACDASRVVIQENDKGEPLEIGRKTRTVPPAIRRALNSRDKGCQFPGCTHQRFLDAHHVKHWAQGGETALSNLVLLCRFHHRAVHEGGIRIKVLESGTFQFIRQDGRAFDGVLKPMELWESRHLMESNLEHGVKIDANTASTLWRGERMDYGLAIASLMLKRTHVPRVSAETRRL